MSVNVSLAQGTVQPVELFGADKLATFFEGAQQNTVFDADKKLCRFTVAHTHDAMGVLIQLVDADGDGLYDITVETDIAAVGYTTHSSEEELQNTGLIFGFTGLNAPQEEHHLVAVVYTYKLPEAEGDETLIRIVEVYEKNGDRMVKIGFFHLKRSSTTSPFRVAVRTEYDEDGDMMLINRTRVKMIDVLSKVGGALFSAKHRGATVRPGGLLGLAPRGPKHRMYVEKDQIAAIKRAIENTPRIR